jgi:hypothetical protein
MSKMATTMILNELLLCRFYHPQPTASMINCTTNILRHVAPSVGWQKSALLSVSLVTRAFKVLKEFLHCFGSLMPSEPK